MKQIRILVIPNITNSRDIESDSFFDVLFQQINQLGNDFFWIVPTIKQSKRIGGFSNVLQIPIEMSGNMFHMRVNMPLELIKILQTSTLNKNRTNDKFYVEYDIVYSHLPDWSIRRYVPTKKKIIGYSHWWEAPYCNGLSNFNNYLNFEREILGVLQMEVCFVNTMAQKKRVIEEAKKTFNESIISQLENIIQVFYLSIAKKSIRESPSNSRYRMITFNHRTTTYKGFPKFMKWMNEFRDIRTDFELWFTQSDKKFSEDWIHTASYSKMKYLDRLSKSLLTVVPKDNHFGWNISGTDSLMVGTPTLFEECINYRELFPNGLFYSNKREFFSIMNNLLDDSKYVKEWGLKSIRRAKELSNNNSIQLLRENLKI